MKRELYFLTIPVGIFSLLFLPFIFSIPFLDGNINFVQSVLFHNGGFDLYFDFFTSVHPPLKILILNILYSIFGIHQVVFSLLGYSWGILGIISFYFLAKKLRPGSEKIGTLLFAVNPLFLATGIFGLTDYILTSLLLFTLLMYTLNKNVLFTLGLISIVLVKEPGLLALGMFFSIDLLCFIKKRNTKNAQKSLLYIIPVSIYVLWDLYLQTKGVSEWSDWIFAETASQGTFYTIFNNLVTLQIFNKYSEQHFLQLLFLNFNWILILFSLLLSVYVLHKKKLQRTFIKMLHSLNQESKTTLFIICFCLLYSLTILTFQTYTIPRYALPIIPFIILWFSITLNEVHNIYIKRGIASFACIISFVGLFFSIDPIATQLWGKTTILGQEIYATNSKLSGNDGFTYNFQYLLMIRKRTNLIYGNTNIDDCGKIFLDPNNERVTIQTLNLANQPTIVNCGLAPVR